MLTFLVPVLAVLAVPSPAPSSSALAAPAAASAPAASQLKEIGHVEAHSACAAIVDHANAAIGDAIANDNDLALTINRLRTTDLDDDNEIKRRNGMNDLETLSGRIRMAAFAGNRDVKQLRTLVAQTTQPERKAELKAFTDALSGALTRQRVAATNLDKMLTIIDGRRAVAEVNATEAADPMIRGASRVPDAAPAGPALNPAVVSPAPVDGMLRDLAASFTDQAQAILSDEATAAAHTDGATAGC